MHSKRTKNQEGDTFYSSMVEQRPVKALVTGSSPVESAYCIVAENVDAYTNKTSFGTLP